MIRGAIEYSKTNKDKIKLHLGRFIIINGVFHTFRILGNIIQEKLNKYPGDWGTPKFVNIHFNKTSFII
jgi:hypothetical protein